MVCKLFGEEHDNGMTKAGPDGNVGAGHYVCTSFVENSKEGDTVFFLS